MNDLISRQDALNQIMKKRWALQMMDDTHTADKIMDGLRRAEIVINELPSAQKQGKWIRHTEIKNVYGGIYIECSECGEKYVVQYIDDEKYCRHCGARMVKGEEE